MPPDCFSIVVWLLFIFDQRLISRRTKDASGQRLERLMFDVRKDQNLNIFCLVPALIAFHAVAAWFCSEANARWPDWVLLSAILQFVCLAAYLVYFLRTMARVSSRLIQERRAAGHSGLPGLGSLRSSSNSDRALPVYGSCFRI